MHSSFKVGDTVLMASDGMCSGEPKTEFKGISLTLNPKTEAECERLFGALADGGQVFQPLIKTFFSPKFGVVTDKFGLNWMVLVEQEMASKAA
jgi:PhnB protein